MLNCDFQKLQDEMASATKLACITVDYTGTPITSHSRCSEFCNVVRNHPELKVLCEKCDSRGGLEAARLKKPYLYTCHFGIVDVAIPIIYQNLYIGAVMCGQVLLSDCENHNIEKIIFEQSDFNFCDNAEELYNKLTVMKKADIDASIDLISYLCNYRLSSVLSNNENGNILPSTQTFKRINKNASIIQPALNYIRENHVLEIKLQTVAEMCDVSPSYFSKLFKKVTGVNLITYINKARIEHGKHELLTSNKSVQVIAKEVGFDDSGYFIKVFKGETGVTPNSFRDKNTI